MGEYLPNKRGIVGVFEVFGEYLFGELLFLDHNETNSGLGPSDGIAIYRILSYTNFNLKYLVCLL